MDTFRIKGHQKLQEISSVHHPTPLTFEFLILETSQQLNFELLEGNDLILNILAGTIYFFGFHTPVIVL